MKKKLVCLLLVVCFVFTNVSFAFAATPESTQKRVLIDTFETEYYEMAAYYEGETVYVITLFNDGRIELACGKKSGELSSVWLTATEICEKDQEKHEVSNVTFAETVINYGKEKLEPCAVLADITTKGESSTRSYEYNGADEYALVNRLIAIHGTSCTNQRWVTPDLVSGGLTYSFRENRLNNMYYFDYVAYEEWMTFGQYTARFFSMVTGSFFAKVSLTAIRLILGESLDNNSELTQNGAVILYNGEHRATRFVTINGAGPYYQCTKAVDYYGFVNKTETGQKTYRIECKDTRYSPTMDIYSDKDMQKQLAYENYA